MKKRINITMSEELLSKIDSKCNEMGVTRSSYIANKIATSIAQEENAMNGIMDVVKQVLENQPKAKE